MARLTFEPRVTVVNVPCVVRERGGGVVTDLDKDDFDVKPLEAYEGCWLAARRRRAGNRPSNSLVGTFDRKGFSVSPKLDRAPYHPFESEYTLPTVWDFCRKYVSLWLKNRVVRATNPRWYVSSTVGSAALEHSFLKPRSLRLSSDCKREIW